MVVCASLTTAEPPALRGLVLSQRDKTHLGPSFTDKKGPDETGSSGLRCLIHPLDAHAALGMGVVFDSGETRCRPLLRRLLLT